MLRGVFCIGLGLGLGLGSAAAAPDEAARVMELLESGRLEEALPIMEASRGRAGLGPFLEGAYELYLGAYADSARSFDAALAGNALDARLVDEARSLRALAHSTDEVTRGFVEKTSAHFSIKVAPGKDEVLIAPALDTLERAYAAIGGDLGEQPPGLIRVEIYGDERDLAKVSPLSVTAIKTSGTIALCKFNRVMATSPRATIAGYPWLDTIAHELTHYLIARASRNQVPIWLHEGIAKTEERRWREPFGGPLPPTLEHVLATGLRDGHLITFAAMHPSMALLPSQADAALAYAEVASAVQLITEKRGAAALRQLLGSLRDGADMNHAITAVTGLSFAAFEKSWRGWMKGRGYKLHPEMGLSVLRFHTDDGGKGAARNDPRGDDESQVKEPAHSPMEKHARDHVRLGTMLRTRGRLAGAAAEYERASALFGPGHPEVASKLGRTYLELRDWDHAIAAARPGIARRPDSAGLQVTVGRALLEKGDAAGARSFLEAALAINPFDPQTRCGLARAYRTLADPRLDAEAAACTKLGGTP